MKKPFGRFIVNLLVYIAFMFLLNFINGDIGIEIYLSFFVFFALIYAGIEALLSLINNGNSLVIIGFLILMISVITMAGGLWEENNKFIYKPFIIAVAAAAVYITFRDLLDIADFSERTKKVINICSFITVSCIIITILMVTHPFVSDRIENLNTDYLTFISLGITISTMGLRQQKQMRSEKKNTNP